MGECCNNKEDISLSCHCGANDSFKSSSSQLKCQNCSVKKKVRSEKEFKALLNRLSRIEGQVRGVRSMLENDAYCIDILTQVSAINAALNSFNKILIANHIRTCVADAKWVYENCNGATIHIYSSGKYSNTESFKGPLGRRPLATFRGAGNFDPTDPEVP